MLTCAVAGPTAEAAEGPDERRSSSLQRRLMALMRKSERVAHWTDEERRASFVRRLAAARVDWDGFCELVLVDAAHRLTPEEEVLLCRTLRDTITRRMVAQLGPDLFDEGRPAVAVRADDRAWRATLTLPSRPEAVHLTLTGPESEWKVVDLELADAALSRQYRGLVNKQLRRFGLEELLRKLNEAS